MDNKTRVLANILCNGDHLEFMIKKLKSEGWYYDGNAPQITMQGNVKFEVYRIIDMSE